MIKTVKITVNAKLKAGIKFDEEANVYVGYTPALGVYSQAKNEERAKLALEDAVHSFLLVAHKNGLLEKCLRNTGFVAAPGSLKELKGAEQYIAITEETILEEKQFKNIFDIPASLPLATVAA